MRVEMKNSVLVTLGTWSGIWEGDGINHEQQSFHAVLVARPLFGNQSIILWFRAAGLDGKRYHEEVSLLGPGIDTALSMASVNSNMPFVQQFVAHALAQAEIVEVHHGDHSNVQSFRETVSLQEQGGNIRMSFLWGMPGEQVVPRSSVVLSRSEAALPSTSPLR